MIIRFARTVTLPSGNLARNFRFNDRGYGRVQVTYEYTDRRRNHQTARRANGGRVEFFKSSTILAELLKMLAEFNEASQDVAQHRYAPAKVEAPVEQDNTASNTSTGLKDTVELLRGVVMINILITLVTLGIVWCNL